MVTTSIALCFKTWFDPTPWLECSLHSRSDGRGSLFSPCSRHWNRGFVPSALRIFILLTALTILPGQVSAQQLGGTGGSQDFPHKNLLAVGQGVSSPAVTSGTLISNGFARENPVSAAFVNNYRGGVTADLGDNFGLGADFGWGDATYGVSLGYRLPSCEGCNGFPRGQVAANWGGLGMGLGLANGLYTLGLLFNGRGKNRVGILAEIDNGTFFQGRTTLGLGYSYVNHSLTATIDGSYVNYEGLGSSFKLTPGVSLRIRQIAVSFNYDLFLEDFEQRGDQGWFGVGYTYKDQCHLALYFNYVNSWTLAANYFF